MGSLFVSDDVDLVSSGCVSFKERELQLVKQDELDKEAVKKAKGSPFRKFIQVNKETYDAEVWLASESLIAFKIYKFLVKNMDHYNAVICSHPVLMENFDVSKRTVTRAITLLKKHKFLDVYKSGSSNVYAINKTLVWSSWGSNYKYAKFAANVVLSNSEQDRRMEVENGK